MSTLTYSQKIKAAILNDLQSLVPATLGDAFADDLSKVSPLDRDWKAFPSAVVLPPTVENSEYYDTATNLRVYTFWVAIVTKPEFVEKDPTLLEGLMDAVMNAFDQDVTLQGSSVGGVEPAVIQAPGPVSSSGVTYVLFYITLRAKQLVTAAVKL
jgi:hypothetical protein